MNADRPAGRNAEKQHEEPKREFGDSNGFMGETSAASDAQG